MPEPFKQVVKNCVGAPGTVKSGRETPVPHQARNKREKHSEGRANVTGSVAQKRR